MSRKSVSRKSSRSPVPPMEKPNLNEERLDLDNIMQINPWKDVDKYDKQEVGQIQEILVQFNNMVVEDKKNKRRSVGKSRAPTLSPKAPTGNEDLEEASTTKKTIKNDKKHRSKSESGSSIAIQENVMADKTNGVRITNEKPPEELEEHLEEKKEKSSKSKNNVELTVPLDDKKNKRKSVEKHRASPSSSKATNDADLEVETTKNKMIRNDECKSCINKSSIDMFKNLSIGNTSDNPNGGEKPVVEDEDHPEEETEKSSKSTYPVELDEQLDKKYKRKSVAQRRTSTSLSKVTNDAYLEVETTKNKMIRNDMRKNRITEPSVDTLKNLSIDNRNIEEKPVEEDEDHPEEREEKSSKSTIYPVELDVQLDKKNKRKSPSQRRTSSSSSKVTNDAYPEEKTMENKMTRNNKKKSCMTELSIDMLKNVSIENTSDNKNMEGDEDHPEEKKEKSSKSTYPVGVDVQLDNKNKRKSPSQRRASPKATGSNADLEEKTKKKEKMRNDAIKHWISESSVNDTIINVPENVATKNSSNNQNNVDEERKAMREENKDLSSKVINRVEQRSAEKRLISSSAMKTIASNNAAEGQSNVNKKKFQYWLITSDGAGSIVDPEENIGSDHKRDNISNKEKIGTQKLEVISGETISETVAEKIVDVHDPFTIQLPEISGSVSPASKKNESSYVEGIECDDHSFNDDFVNNESIISGHLRYQNFQVFSSTNKLEKLDQSESQSENRNNSVLQSDDQLAKPSSTMKPRAVSLEPERKSFAEYSEKKCESKNTLNPESEETNMLKKEAELTVKQSWSMKARSASAEPAYKKFAEYNNNGFESKHARKREEKMAKAFEKFGKKFVKYSNRIEKPQNHEIEPNDVTLDSESDSYSSDSSSTSNSNSSSSSDSDESSFSESTSSNSTCSCCSESSSDSSYTSYSGSTSCSCPSCCEDDIYSEYTLASSSSTHPGSDESTDYSTD